MTVPTDLHKDLIMDITLIIITSTIQRLHQVILASSQALLLALII